MIHQGLERGRRGDHTQRSMSHGLSITRRIMGPLEDLYAKFDELQQEYPTLELRKEGDKRRRAPALQQLGSKEVWANRERIGYVAASAAFDSIMARVTSL